MIEVSLPDGRVFEVETTDPDVALQAAREFLGREKAQGRIAAEDAQRGPVSRFMKNVSDGTTQIAAGIPFAGGLVDEGNAMVRSGGGLWGNYEDELAYERERQAQAWQRSPTASTANTLAGGLGGGAAMIPGKILAGGSTLGNFGKAAGIGGGAGAVEGFTRGEGGFENRVNAMPLSAGFGAAFGGAGPAIGKMIGAGVNAATRNIGPVPTVGRLKEMAREGYEKAKNAGLVFKPESYSRLVDDIATAAEDYGIGGKLAQITRRENPTTSRLVDQMQKSKGASPDFMDVERMKRIAYNSRDPAAPMIGGKLRRAIDESTADDYIAGDVDEGLAGIAQGRDSWARAERGKVIDDAVRAAQLDSGTKFTQAGYEHALRQQFKAIAKSDEFQYWPKAEQDAVLKVVNGSFGQNALRLVGAVSPKGGLSTMFNTALTVAMPPVGVPVALGTTLARMGASKMGITNARLASALVKGGKEIGPTNQSLLAQKVAQQLMLSQSGQAGEKLAAAARGGR